MPLSADLYLDQIDLARHWGRETCEVCHVDSLQELLERLRAGRVCIGQCLHWTKERVEAFQIALDSGCVLPQIPCVSVPQPVEAGLFGVNGPTAASPVLVTGNSRLTHEVLLSVLATTSKPMWMLAVDAGGHTVDMSLVYATFTAEAIVGALALHTEGCSGQSRRIILPGLAEPLARDVSHQLGCPIEVGPICAAELPLFFGSDWKS